MTEKVVPMIHVPNVRETVNWYESIGFSVNEIYGNDGDGLSFAFLSFGSSSVMFNQGGQPSKSHRREVDLYVYTDDVDALHQRIKDRVEVVEELHNTFYGMREFIIRDPNRFWITFGQPSVFAVLLSGIRDGNTDVVRAALESGRLKPEALTAALAAASSTRNTPDKNKKIEIMDLLKRAGAVAPFEVPVETLQSYVGTYQGEQGFEIRVTLEGDELFATQGSDQRLSLLAVDQITFRPITLDDYGTIKFHVEAGNATGCTLNHAEHSIPLKRVE